MFQMLLDGLNPEPWTAGDLSTMRKGGRVIPITLPNGNLRSYKETVKEMVGSALEELGIATPVFPKDTPLMVHFYYWRQWQEFTIIGRKARRKHSDTSNMTKALEDALQGLIYHNDSKNVVAFGHTVESGPDVDPKILFHVDLVPDWMAAAANGLVNATRMGESDSTKTIFILR